MYGIHNKKTTPVTPTTQFYNIDPASITENFNQISFDLALQTNATDSSQVEIVSAEMIFYEGNIMRLRLNELNGTEKRFSISSEPDFAVVESQLKPITPIFTKEDDHWKVQAGKDDNDYFEISFFPFRVQSYVNDKLVMTLNDQDTLYFEKSTGKNNDTCLDSEGAMEI